MAGFIGWQINFEILINPALFAMKYITFPLKNYILRTSLLMIRQRQRPGRTLRSRGREDIRSKLWHSRTRPARPPNRIRRRRRRRRRQMFLTRGRDRKFFHKNGRDCPSPPLPTQENRRGTVKCSKKGCRLRFRRLDCRINWTEENKFKRRRERGEIHCWAKNCFLSGCLGILLSSQNSEMRKQPNYGKLNS